MNYTTSIEGQGMNIEHIYALVDDHLDVCGTIAIVVRRDQPPGLSFYTSPDAALQVGGFRYIKGRKIDAHTHNDVPRTVRRTQETIFVVKGCLRVDLYSERRTFSTSRVLYEGDCIVLLGGGHGFEVLEDVEVFYCKSGPYMGEADKARFYKDEKVISPYQCPECKGPCRGHEMKFKEGKQHEQP